MARPRVFVSSTYYDLKYLRSSLEVFIESLGYDAVLSEKGDIAYAHDMPLDESCYQEVANCDIFVLIVGGRYGSQATTSATGEPDRDKQFYDRYESITKMEYKSAVEADIPVYILIEGPVYAEYWTYLRNKDKTGFEYAHADSVNVFRFIEEILAQRRNNPVQGFEKPSDIEDWLREQWAGRFRDLLRQRSSQQQIASLAAQVQALSELNVTLKTYLEEVIKTVSADKGKAENLITTESERLDEAKRLAELENNGLVKWLMASFHLSLSEIVRALRECHSLEEFLTSGLPDVPPEEATRLLRLGTLDVVVGDANQARRALGLPPWTPKKQPGSASPATPEARKKARGSTASRG